MACPICQQRKAKRACPAKGEPICSLCCGREREQTIACPFDCTYLQDARAKEGAALDPADMPYKDVRLEDRFLDDHVGLVETVARSILIAALETPGALDSDAREALDAAIQTQRTLEGGIYYETRPDSSFARTIVGAIQAGVEGYRNGQADELGVARTTDADVLKTLVFLLRLAKHRDNGRAKARGFLHLLARQFDMEKQAPLAGGLIVPGR
jgi:hypothetical protein